LKIKKADKQYKNRLRALAVVGDIIIYLWSRLRSVTDIFKRRTNDGLLKIYN
jgi:hypothetical protein